MKHILGVFFMLVLIACQPNVLTTDIIILDGQNTIRLQTNSVTPVSILAEAGISFSEADKLLFHGADLPADFPLPPGGTYILQVQRAHNLTIITPDHTIVMKTTAISVEQALRETNLTIYSSDFFSPALNTHITSDLTVTYRPAREFTISLDGISEQIKSSQSTIGQALASSGLALTGLDDTLPDETEPLPLNGEVQIIRSKESITLNYITIPFSSRFEYSIDLPAGQQEVLQPGETGLSITIIRTRYKKGAEVSSVIESEELVRKPKDAVIAFSQQAQINSINTPSGPMQYWRSVQMYATSYSPCRSGTTTCHYGTASGLPVQQGVVAMTRSLYNQLSGTKVYIPGYGIGIIGDIGGGFPDGRLWIDLGYSDEDYQSWSGAITVYFLVPAPAVIPAELN